MKLNKILFGLCVYVSFNALATKPAPVINVNGTAPVNINNTSNASLMSVADQIAELNRKLDARNKAQLSVQQQLNDLQDEVNELRGVTELHTHQLSQILERQRELYQELDRRVNEALKAPVPETLSAPDKSIAISYSDNLSENESYDKAVNLVLKDKQYEQAIAEFKNFNKKFPTSTYSANAHYWLGQLLFNKGELAQATVEFSSVVNKYKQSAKRGDSLLKMGLIAQKQQQLDKAKKYYQQVIVEYADSSSAQLAKSRLNSLQP